LAALAREAEVERLSHLFVLAYVRDVIALEHLPQQARAPARRMHLLARDLQARAHRSAIRAPALANSHASHRRLREIAVLLRELKVRPHAQRAEVRAIAQVLVRAIWIDDLARIHHPAGIPHVLELTECLDQRGRKHLRQELRARLAVAMLARQGA